jgi:TRAP-type C4-dicarboxylate transport system substrate-binding protein
MIGPRHLAACAAALALAALPGCLGDSEGTKAGGEAGPLTLRVGTDDPAGRPGEEQIQELARRLAELSDGELRLKPVLNAGGDGRDWDQLVAHRVADGDLDLGLVPSRAFDTEGVTTLRALNAPFLITGDELFGEVIAGPLASRLMSGLDEAGVVGLAMFPEGMRHPFGFQKPLRGPGDYAGQEIRTPTSETVTAMFAALGARTDDMDPDAGVQAGMESAYDLQPTGTATGNVTFYPKADVLVVSPGLLDKLGEERTEILRRAARETRDLLIEQRTSDADAAAAWCDDGHSIALAGDAELAALERATEPVYDALERDPRPEGTRQHSGAAVRLRRAGRLRDGRGGRGQPPRRRLPLREHGRSASARGRNRPCRRGREPRPVHRHAPGRGVLLEAARAEPAEQPRRVLDLRARRRPDDVELPDRPVRGVPRQEARERRPEAERAARGARGAALRTGVVRERLAPHSHRRVALWPATMPRPESPVPAAM